MLKGRTNELVNVYPGVWRMEGVGIIRRRNP